MSENKQLSKKEINTDSAAPMQLLQMAVQNNFDIDKLKQLMDLQERWEKKEAKKSFLVALSKFQTIVPNLKKSKIAKVSMTSGGQFQYAYADLGSITKQIKQALNECGLSYRWEFAEEGSKMKVTCIVSHLDGHFEATTMEGGLDNSGAKNVIQQKGSTHTYLQRYTLIGALGLSTLDEDKDANTARPKPSSTGITEEESLEQWRQVLSEVKNKTHLHSLYLQNKSVVDNNANIQALFKEKQAQFKNTDKMQMP
jgi:hypothetical protein